MKYISTGLIVFFVAVVGSVIGGVCLCAYFYKEGKRKSQIRPEDHPVARMTEPFNTKKLWERGKRKPAVTLTENSSIQSISINGVIAKGPDSDAGGGDNTEKAVVMVGDAAADTGGINPCSSNNIDTLSSSAVPDYRVIVASPTQQQPQQQQQQQQEPTENTRPTTAPATTVVEVT